MEQLLCHKCKCKKDNSEFRPRKNVKSGHNSWCKDCHRVNQRSRYVHIVRKPRILKLKEPHIIKEEAKIRMLKHRYNLSMDDYEKLYINQNKCCAICKEPKELGGRTGLYIDHSHKTNMIRGLLCPSCNSAIGKLKDDINIFLSAIEYLKRHD